MNYLVTTTDGKLNNEMHLITYDDIRKLYEENKKDENEVKNVTASSNRGETYYNDGITPGNEKIDNFNLAFLKEVVYRDSKTSGFLMEYPHGTVIRQGERNHYYRGENQIFPKSQPTLLRKMELYDSEQERMLERLIAYMRIAEFKLFISQFDIVKNWASDVLYEPLAQHYGLDTEWLDITNDFKVALFFATCYWDSILKKWLPLTKEQTVKNERSKYGIIFHMPYWQNPTRLISYANGDKNVNLILPIGFQPFMRCHMQTAYAIKMEKPFPLQDDIGFEKLYFRHSEKLSREVFELMDCGRKIYPQEGLGEFKDIIDGIKGTLIFSESAFFDACDTLEIKDTDNCRRLLQDRGVSVVSNNSRFKISRQRFRAMNRKYADFSLEKYIGSKIHCRITHRGI